MEMVVFTLIINDFTKQLKTIILIARVWILFLSIWRDDILQLIRTIYQQSAFSSKLHIRYHTQYADKTLSCQATF